MLEEDPHYESISKIAPDRIMRRRKSNRRRSSNRSRC